MTAHDRYSSPLAERYASPLIKELWSPAGRIAIDYGDAAELAEHVECAEHLVREPDLRSPRAAIHEIGDERRVSLLIDLRTLRMIVEPLRQRVPRLRCSGTIHLPLDPQ